MKLSAPHQITFLVSLVLAILGLLPLLGIAVPVVGAFTAWLLPAGYILLALSVILNGL